MVVTSHRQLVQLAERMRQDFLQLPGVKKVNILGEQAQRIYVEFSYQRLATLGLTPEQIFTALARQNAVVPLRYGGKPLPEAVVYSVMGYFYSEFYVYSRY